MGKIYKSLILDEQVSLSILETTDIVNQAIVFHKLSPVCAAALGRSLTATAFMACGLKNKKEKLLDYQKDLNRLFKNKISDEKYRIEHLSSDYKKLLQNIVSIKQKELSKFQISLQKYDSTWLKENGYSLIFQNGKKITSASELNKDSEIVITYSDGERKAVIKD